MNRLRSLSILTAVLFAAGSNLAAQTTAYVGASVWDGTGASIIRNATMVVEDGRITAVSRSAEIPTGTEIVFLEGKVLIPGLINTHDPNYALPLAAARQLEKEGIIGKIFPMIFSLPGVATAQSDSLSFGAKLANELRDNDVGAALLVAT